MADSPPRLSSSRNWWNRLQPLLSTTLLLLGIIWLSAEQALLSQQVSSQQRDTALQIAHAQQQANILSTYQASISNMLLHDNLSTAGQTSKERLVAQTQTAQALRQLDADGKGMLIRFLYETKLINNDTPVISLRELDLHEANLRNSDLRDTYLFGADMHGADARGINLSYATLDYTNMAGANLAGADLHGSDMKNIDLSNADLTGANLKDITNLTQEQLAKVKTLAGATMPNGSTHR